MLVETGILSSKLKKIYTCSLVFLMVVTVYLKLTSEYWRFIRFIKLCSVL